MQSYESCVQQIESKESIMFLADNYPIREEEGNNLFIFLVVQEIVPELKKKTSV